MKKTISITLLLLNFILSTNAQNEFYFNGSADVIFRYPPRGAGGRAFVHADGNVLSLNFASDFTGGTRIGNDVFFKDNGNSYIYSGNFGIGTTNPTEKLTIAGSHGDTKLRLYSTGNGSDEPANLSLWASEPGWTYYGTGIGYNVNGSPYYGRIDNNRGSSYVRFLPSETKFEFQNTSGSYINALTIKESGNVGIGTTTPNTKLDVNGSTLIHGSGTYYNNAGAAELQVGYGLATSCTAGSVTRFALQPYAHTGGPWNFISRDDAVNAWLDIKYGTTVGITLKNDGYIGIGTTNPDEKLTVNGVIHAREVKVDLNVPLADFVFKPDYKLMSLPQVEQFVKANNHLPQMPSAEEVAKNGLSMGEMQNKLLQKVEELTLYVIEQQKTISIQQSQIRKLNNKFNNHNNHKKND